MTQLRSLGAAGAALLVAGLVVSPAVAATALNGSVFQSALADVFQVQISDGVPVSQAANNSWNATPRTLSASVNVLAHASDGADATDNVHSTISAQWTSANSGSVDVTDRGWTFAGANIEEWDTRSELNTAASGLPDWSYGFVAGGDGFFDLVSEFIGGGTDDLGLGLWKVGVSVDGGAMQLTTLHQGLKPGDDVTNSFGLPVLGGHTYQVALFSSESAEFFTARSLTAAETDHFTWSIRDGTGAAPEPAAWALAVLGFGLSGAALRRRAIPARA